MHLTAWRGDVMAGSADYVIAVVKPGLASCLKRHIDSMPYRDLPGKRVRVLKGSGLPALIRGHSSVLVVPEDDTGRTPVRICDKFLQFLTPSPDAAEAKAPAVAAVEPKSNGGHSGAMGGAPPAVKSRASGERRVRVPPPNMRRRGQSMRGSR